MNVNRTISIGHGRTASIASKRRDRTRSEALAIPHSRQLSRNGITPRHRIIMV
jgi:hypothetical protein